MLAHGKGWWLPAIVVAAAVAGCAPAYHAYPSACPTYAYCPQPPLPYRTYDACHCPTPIATQWLESQGDMPREPIPNSPGEAVPPGPNTPAPLPAEN